MLPEKTEVLREWLQKSAQDLQVAQYLLKAKPPFTESACFHARQCAEKFLKTYLISKEVRPWKTHSIEEIGNKALKFEPTLKKYIRAAEKLSDYAVTVRYPGDDDPPTLKAATTCVKVAKTLFEQILKRLPKECHPVS